MLCIASLMQYVTMRLSMELLAAHTKQALLCSLCILPRWTASSWAKTSRMRSFQPLRPVTLGIAFQKACSRRRLVIQNTLVCFACVPCLLAHLACVVSLHNDCPCSKAEKSMTCCSCYCHCNPGCVSGVWYENLGPANRLPCAHSTSTGSGRATLGVTCSTALEIVCLVCKARWSPPNNEIGVCVEQC